MAQQEPRGDLLGRMVHWTLLGGATASAALLICGLWVMLAQGPPHIEAVHGFGQLVPRALAGEGVAIVDLGLVVLMLTPASRVVVLAVGWALRRQWRMAAVALTVAALLAFSIGLGVG
jgi:uncharacterized membrane protein